jgi:hypothetical protein
MNESVVFTWTGVKSILTAKHSKQTQSSQSYFLHLSTLRSWRLFLATFAVNGFDFLTAYFKK